MSQYYHIKIRRDTAARWASNNPTPADGELCLESNTNKIKFGDGVTAYNNLPYFAPANATQLAAGLMSAADKTKLDGINIADYAPLNSPVLTGTPKAVTNGYMPDRTIATDQAVLNRIAEAAIPLLAVRVVYSVGANGEYTIIGDENALSTCVFMSVNGAGVKIEKQQKLVAGDNYIDFIFKKGEVVQVIPDNTFVGISEIKEAYIPERVTKIGNMAFKDTGLSKLYVYGVTPATLGADCFDGTAIGSVSGVIYVHREFLTSYTSAWSTFASEITYL